MSTFDQTLGKTEGRSARTGVDRRSSLLPRPPQPHRTVDRVTRILEEVVYKPGMTFGEIVRALNAPKSSVHGFVSGLLAKGWLYEVNHRYYLGAAVYSLTLASGHVRAGVVTHADLSALHRATGLAVFLGVQAGDQLIYIAEAGSDAVASFEARTNIRRTLLATAGGKALLASRPASEREAYLRRRPPEEAPLVERYRDESDRILRTRIATNARAAGSRLAIATNVYDPWGEAVAAVTLLGLSAQMNARVGKLGDVLLRHVDRWSRRAMSPREAI